MSSSTTVSTVLSDETIGWVAAFLSCLAFGSFGVPIKCKAARDCDIDPLVFQSYKTLMCFVTSWIPIIAFNAKFTFSPWGIVSGFFWVPGGIATVYAVKTAGLAIGIGIGSSFIVLVSFVWGIFVFDERIHSKFGACFAIACMMAGLFGMSYYSAPNKQASMEEGTAIAIMAAGGDDDDDERGEPAEATATVKKRTVRDRHRYEGVSLNQSDDGDDEENGGGNDDNDDDHGGLHHRQQHSVLHDGIGVASAEDNSNLKTTERTLPLSSFCSDDTSSDQEEGGDNGDDEEFIQHLQLQQQHGDDGLLVLDDDNGMTDEDEQNIVVVSSTATIACCGIPLTKRQSGMLAAAFCGLWGGSIMVPMKFCTADTSGIHYLVSFSIGASIVTVSFWILRFLAYTVRFRSPRLAYEQLPSFHLRKMWLPGGTSGLLWSIGNFFSLISVYYLGEGVGYPLVQTSILVSGIWGIFYHKEVTGTEQITKWLISSLVTIFGILLLSYEHHEK